MSFQDFGKNSSNRRVASATLTNRPTSIPEASTPWSSSSGGSGQVPSIGQISESLTQYQRNVGILEKIAQSMLTPGPGSNQSTRQELEQQYQVQLDVLRQLEARTREQLQTQRKIKPNINNNSEANKQQTLIKLERDFDRVQVIATNTKAKVARQQKQLQQRGQANAANAARNNNNNTPTHINAAAESLQQDQQRFQLQLQQDRLHQEIMTEREQEIRNINKGMHQVNEIYKDLAHIVGSQQEHVDQIETQMDNAKGNAESGLSQVQKANEKYNQSQCTIS